MPDHSESQIMFCVHCGVDGAEAFCPACGKRQKPEKSVRMDVDLEATSGNAEDANGANHNSGDDYRVTEVSPRGDWTMSLHYEHVLAVPEARQRIAAASTGTAAGVTAEDLLKIFDAVSPIGISMEKLSGALIPIADKMGIKMQQAASAIFPAPPGRVLLATLCVLATRGMELLDAKQLPEACALVAKIPSGLYTNPGQLNVVLRIANTGVLMQLEARIAGQYYDWGKSKRMINQIFMDVGNDLMAQMTSQAVPGRRIA